MRILLTGGAKNGKSHLAQDLALALAAGGPHYYIATMIPTDDEDRRRIRLHLLDRDGLGFETIECGRSIGDVLLKAAGRGTYLFDSLTALLANEMFSREGTDMGAAERILPEIRRVLETCEHMVVVSDGIFSDAAFYDEYTEAYREGLGLLQRETAAMCDIVLEMTAGVPKVLKGRAELEAIGKKKEDMAPEDFGKKRERAAQGKDGGKMRELVIGGAAQGKTAYIYGKYAPGPEEVCVCVPDAEPDFSARVLLHLERYVLYCIRSGCAMRTDFRKDAVLCCEDIFCGVVPIDPEMRRWREEAGRYMQRVATLSDTVTRISCGIPEILREPCGPDEAEDPKEAR